MQAIISGSAAIAFVRSSPSYVLDVDGGKREFAYSDGDIARLFSSATDAFQSDFGTVEEIETRLEQAWATDRAFRLFLSLFDPSEPEDDGAEIVACLSELLEVNGVSASIIAKASTNVLPGPFDIKRLRTAISEASSVEEIVDAVLDLQPTIKNVNESYRLASESLFGERGEKESIRCQLISSGSWSEIVGRLSENQSLQFEKLNVLHRFVGAREGLSLWFAKMQPGLRRAKALRAMEEDEDDVNVPWATETSGSSGYAAFSNAQAQIRGVVERIQAHDVAAAMRFADALVESQKNKSTSEQIAKTLSNLAQQAKSVEEYSLQLMWAERSYRSAQTDLVAAGHLVDAYLNNEMVVEAHKLLNQIEAQGGQRYAIAARARIMRMEGEYETARANYLKALELFPDDAESWRCAASAAECLKDMNRPVDALAEYEDAILRWPLERMLQSGKASTLLMLGRFDEAASIFRSAETDGRDRHVAENGRATALRHAGKFTEALEVYDRAARSRPGEPITLSGRAETLRDMGNLEGGLEAYADMKALIPSSRQSWVGYASVLKELGRFKDAEATYLEGLRLHEHDERLSVGLGNIWQRTGRVNEALSLFDALAARYPFNAFAKLGRAESLKRMGQFSEAAQEIDLILRDTPDFQTAITAKAALLIAQDRTREALNFLPTSLPTSQLDWDRFILRTLATRQRQGAKEAIQLAEPLLRNVQFARQRRMLASLLASMKLETGLVKDASRLAEFRPAEATNVIFLHTLAADSRKAELAPSVYRDLQNSEAPANLIILADEVARRFRIVSEQPKHDLAWIFAQERAALLLEIG